MNISMNVPQIYRWRHHSHLFQSWPHKLTHKMWQKDPGEEFDILRLFDSSWCTTAQILWTIPKGKPSAPWKLTKLKFSASQNKLADIKDSFQASQIAPADDNHEG